MSVGPAELLPSEWLSGEVAVLGLERSGRSAARLLARAGAKVYASDVSRSSTLEETAAELRNAGVDVEVGGHDMARIAKATIVVASPGIPPGAPPLLAARRASRPIVSEIEIGLRCLPTLDYVAVTGTNGKTTTTALIARMLSTLGKRAASAGNIGTPLTELALRDDAPQWVALELSSFQLHDTPSVAPRVGVLTNLSANHLDRYASVDEYFGDKVLMFRNANPQSVWVTNADDDAVRSMTAGVPGTHCRFSIATESDAYLDRDHGMLVVFGVPVIRRDDLHLIGDHNVANALAAALAVCAADESHRTDDAFRAIGRTLSGFRSLENRIELVGEIDGVSWINDSKSTSVASTLVALKSMTRPTVVLLGGRHKGEPYTELIPELGRRARAVVAFGEAAPLIEQDLASVVPLTRLGSSFEEVVDAARRLAHRGDAVLLSPACSSYDMFDNYEQRGVEFKRLAMATTSRGKHADGARG
ncbi:MAG TPA: UDP-N-acetylmuramoyl-L-alanine--D-glutamate ligase [Gemmatimonadaceae bacterium]|jgi:UDP-N-acetylmuramoylalanine--D-glutamate ligase|nr:UDP-N-acetylmuramoyl-L-alanine--D-glutamate ligase [Gemmatimonadaceae bacterium]